MSEMKTYKSVIEETVAFYGEDPVGRRSLNPHKVNDNDPRCLYVGENGKRCAFARCVAPESVDYLRDYEGKNAATAIHGLDEKRPVELHPDYAHLRNSTFWNELQYLHDTDAIWWSGGLRPASIQCVETFIRRWDGAERREDHEPDSKIESPFPFKYE